MTRQRDQGLLGNIQALRAIAAIGVVFVHLELLLKELGLDAFGCGGVDLFFVISGYLMVHTTRARPPSTAKFFLNRVVRIVPIYWIATLCVFSIALLAPTLLKSTRAELIPLVKSLLFIPFKKSTGPTEPILFVGWTLNYEMFFYALFALGLSVPRYGRGLFATCAALIALVTAGWLAPPTGVVARFFTSSIILEFVFGIVLAAIIPKIPHCSSSRLKYCVAGIVLLGIVWTMFGSDSIPGTARFIRAGIPGAVVVAGALLLEQWDWKIESKVWLGLGNASYSIYLTHPYVTQAFVKAARATGASGAVCVAWIIATLAAVSLVGWLVHRYLELPSTRIVRAALKRRMAREPVPVCTAGLPS